MLQAVIDIGTNSTRLLVGQVLTNKVITVIKDLITTRTGEGIATANRLLPQAIERTAQAVAVFAQKARVAGAKVIYVYATAATREAENGAELAKRIFELTGLELDIISGEQEALIAYTGAAGGSDAAVIDIGGGSVEIINCVQGKLYCKSVKCGCVRLMERFGGQNGIDEALQMKITEYTDSVAEQYDGLLLDKAAGLIGVSGTPTSLAAVKLQLKQYSGAAVQGVRLTLDEAEYYTRLICRPSSQQRKSIAGLPQDREDILPFGAIMLTSVMRRYGFNQITVSDTDSLEGYLLYRAQNG